MGWQYHPRRFVKHFGGTHALQNTVSVHDLGAALGSMNFMRRHDYDRHLRRDRIGQCAGRRVRVG
jgi:hypothetical protein